MKKYLRMSFAAVVTGALRVKNGKFKILLLNKLNTPNRWNNIIP